MFSRLDQIKKEYQAASDELNNFREKPGNRLFRRKKLLALYKKRSQLFARLMTEADRLEKIQRPG